MLFPPLFGLLKRRLLAHVECLELVRFHDFRGEGIEEVQTAKDVGDVELHLHFGAALHKQFGLAPVRSTLEKLEEADNIGGEVVEEVEVRRTDLAAVFVEV